MRDQPTAAGDDPAAGPSVARTTDTALLRTHAGVLRVRAALAEQGIAETVMVTDRPARSAAEAAQALGVQVGQIAGSQVFASLDRAGAAASLLVLTSGDHSVDVIKIGELLDLVSIVPRGDNEVRQETGFAAGGVPPVGHLVPIRTVIDVGLSRYDEIWAAAGHPCARFATTYDELLRITAGQAVEVI